MAVEAYLPVNVTFVQTLDVSPETTVQNADEATATAVKQCFVKIALSTIVITAFAAVEMQ